MEKYNKGEQKEQLKDKMYETSMTQPSSYIDKSSKQQLNYQLNISNPNQCWQKPAMNTFRATNKFENT